ncbi:MAG: DUF3108 domain-containing protein [Gammaproteobacteria bacterium]|nr:DUF3108 domain-containing protein [Gammaproteobacteria bacterium]
MLTPLWHAAHAQPADLGYQSATYHGRKFGIGIHYDVQIRSQAYDAAGLRWMQLPVDDVAQTRTQAADQPWIHLVLNHRVLGVSATTDTLLDPANGLVIQRIVRRKRGGQVRYKATQYGSVGTRTLRTTNALKPADIEWTEARSSYQPYPPWFGEGTTVSDASALFYLLSGDALQHPGDQLQIPIFSNEHLTLLEFKVTKLTTLKVNYVERSAIAERRIKERRPALLITVGARHLDSDSQEKDLQVLGMQGDLQIFLDTALRVPLRISGRVPKIGKLKLRLKRVDLGP